MAAAQYYDVVQKMYVGYFGRPADPAGLQYWAEKLSANGGDLTAITTGFGNSAEAKALWGSLDTQVAIDALYQQLFNRVAEPAGLIYWTNKIADGTETLATIARALVQGAQNDDVTTLAKKVAVAARYTDAADDTTANILAYKGDAAAAAARAQLKNVTKDTDATTFDVAAIVTAVAAGSTSASTGSTYTLTSGTDSFTGTANNDTFNAGETNPGAGVTDTFTAGDTIDGGAGTDTLNFIKTGAITAIPTGVTVTNVENFKITGGAAVTVDTSSGFTGMTELTVANTGAAQTVTASATQNVTSTVTSQAATAVAINGGNAVSATTTGNSGGTITIGATTASAGAVTVSSTGTYADGADTTMGAIAVTGGSTVTVTQASGITTAQKTSALTDATNNKVTFGAVTVTGNSSTTAVTVNQDAAKTETDSAAGNGQVGVVNGAVTVNDVNASSATVAGTITTVTLGNFAAATVDSSALTTLNLSGNATSLSYSRGALTATPTANTLTVNVTGLTMTGAMTDAEAAADDGFTTINIANNTTASTIASFVAADATTLNVSGDAKLTLTAHTAAALTSITSTNTGGLDMDGTALATGVTFTGGAGADAVSIGSTTKTIDMGAGNDIVTTSSAAVGTGGSVAGGAGTDTIIMTGALADGADANSTFNTKFTGFEVLQLSDAMTVTVDLDGINGASQVNLAAGSNGGTINNLVSGGTVRIDADNAGTLAVGVKSALAGTADILNLHLNKTGGVLAGNTITAANVETVNINVADASTTGSAAVIHTATLTAAAATSIVVTGNNGLTLTATGSTAVTSFDASGVVANDTVASAGVAATTDTAANLAVTYASLNSTASATVAIKGGAGNDTLTGNSAKDTIEGGAGNDIIEGGAGEDTLKGDAGNDTLTFLSETGAGDTLTGGAGNDSFIQKATAAATSVVHTITDFEMGTSTTTVDQIHLSLVALEGLTTTTDIVDTSANSSANTDGTVVALSSDGATVTGADLVVLQNNYASTTAVLAGLKTSGSDTITYASALTDNDSFLIAYSDGTDGYIAVATAGSANLTTSEGVDSVVNILKLTGVTSFANFDSGDFTIIT